MPRNGRQGGPHEAGTGAGESPSLRALLLLGDLLASMCPASVAVRPPPPRLGDLAGDDGFELDDLFFALNVISPAPPACSDGSSVCWPPRRSARFSSL